MYLKIHSCKRDSWVKEHFYHLFSLRKRYLPLAQKNVPVEIPINSVIVLFFFLRLLSTVVFIISLSCFYKDIAFPLLNYHHRWQSCIKQHSVTPKFPSKHAFTHLLTQQGSPMGSTQPIRDISSVKCAPPSMSHACVMGNAYILANCQEEKITHITHSNWKYVNSGNS